MIGSTMPNMIEVAQEKRGPAWAIACFRLFEYLVQVDNLITLTNRGIRHVTSYPGLLELILPDENDPERENDEKRLVKAKELAQLAESEIEKDFPLLHSHAIVGMGCTGSNGRGSYSFLVGP